MVSDFRQADETEAHTETQQTAGASNIRDPAHLLGLAEPLRVGLLDEDVDDGQILASIVVNLVLDFPR